MEFRVFTFTRGGTPMTAIISQEKLDTVVDPSEDLGVYYVGAGVEDWTDQGTVEISGPDTTTMMMDHVMIGQ